MIARVALLVSILAGLTAACMNFRSTPTEVALAKINNADLAATVEALQTQVGEQDARIAKLEEDVAMLLSTGTSSNTAVEGTPGAQGTTGTLQTITGSVALLPPERARDVDELNFRIIDNGDVDYCTGNGGFDDLTGGMGVVIENGSGDTIAVGEAQPGTYSQNDNTCEFAFTVEDVPESDFYAIRISHRSGPTYSYEQLQEMNWHIQLSIG
jgi:hypothetical protein